MRRRSGQRCSFRSPSPSTRLLLNNKIVTPRTMLSKTLSPPQWLLILLLTFVYASTTVVALASPASRTVLVTGGAGYIGSHTCLELLESKDYNVVVVDNLDNSSEESLRRVRELTNCDPDRLHFRPCDVRDKSGINKGENSVGLSTRD